ncbi:hypothetical protein UR09_03470 [Candidatus Nitromaritima sp. SCGC AAA799-A02]|nr:hypothetical protein UZ36_04835 [Candidatus Nitromaritima sp. SCGC AAA799-C22]KMP11375.1 hypothetical protein UR09_03470 [Candidatus Nitromaritima sp. SCGC AAA799-A02]
MAFRIYFIRLVFLLLLPSFFSGCQVLRSLDIFSSGPQGVYHTVQEGQTLYAIARAYDIDVNQLKRVNGVWDPSKLKVGKKLWVPGARRVLEVASTDKKAVASKKKRKAKKSSRKTVQAVKGFLSWPVKGQLTSRFGQRNGRHHDGIDIGARKGTPITAAAGGKVMFSGWGPTGYGLMVIIKHKKNLTTIYAHNSHNHVRKNQTVKQGERIASVGSTGRSTGPHLHFEVRNDTHPQNPLNYLPKR